MPQAYQRRQSRYLELRHRTYLAVMEIPRALRPKLGRARFVRSLETESRTVAEVRAAPIIAGWRQRIAEARGDAPDDNAAFFRRALRDARTDAEREAIKDQAWASAYDIGQEHADPDRDPVDAPEAAEFYARATATGFADLLAEWHATSGVTAKTKDMQATDIRRFAAKFPTVADVTKPAVKTWTDKLKAQGLSTKTVQRILSALRGYWAYLQSRGVAPEGEPFHGLGLTTARNGKQGRVTIEDRRRAFSPSDVLKLLAEARRRGDAELADLIDLARWTGGRIEELCTLKVENVKLRHKIPHFVVVVGKTDAAIRDVPIHSNLLPVVRRLVGQRTDGYVLANLSVNKYGDRSNAIGKRFGYLKRALGFNEQHVFHSIRKTVATLLKDAGVPEPTAAGILGHDIATMSYGLYAEDVSLATKAKTIQKLRYGSR